MGCPMEVFNWHRKHKAAPPASPKMGESERFFVVVYPYDTAEGIQWAFRLLSKVHRPYRMIGGDGGYTSQSKAKDSFERAMSEALFVEHQKHQKRRVAQ